MISTQSLRNLCWAGVGFIAASVAISVLFVLVGTFDDFQIRVILTTLTISFYCFTVAATFGEGGFYPVFGTIGVALAAAGLVTTLPMIWIPSYGDGAMKTAVSLAILAFAFAHGVINYRLSAPSPRSEVVMIMANVAVALVTLLLLYVVIVDGRYLGTPFLKALLSLALIDVGFTIANPIIGKLSRL